MARIVFLNRYFYPDQSATSRILSDLAFHLGSPGRDVSVVTSRQRYDHPRADLPEFEEIRNVQVHRVATSRFGRSGLVGRALDYASFYGSAFRKLRKICKSGDILIAKTDPPLLSILARMLHGSRRLTLINWLQDLYPEVAHELGVPLIRGSIHRSLLKARNHSLRRAHANVVIGTKMAQRLESAGVDPSRIHIIPNWVNEQEIVPVPHASNPLIERWGLRGKFVVGYSGNLGRAHEFDTLLQAAKILKDDTSIVFLIVGSGSQSANLKARASSMGLAASFCFQPYQPEQSLQYSLGVPDVHWISLLPQLEGLIVPSKFYGIIAVGRPVIFIGDIKGELSTIIERDHLGHAVELGNAKRLAEIIAALKDNEQLRMDMARSARQASETLFSRENAFSAWSRVLESVVIPKC